MSTNRSNGRQGTDATLAKETMGRAMDLDNQRQSLEEMKVDRQQTEIDNERDLTEFDDVNWVQLRLEGR